MDRSSSLSTTVTELESWSDWRKSAVWLSRCAGTRWAIGCQSLVPKSLPQSGPSWRPRIPWSSMPRA